MHALAALLALAQAAAVAATATPGPGARAAMTTVAALRRTVREGAAPAAELALASAAREVGPTIPGSFACPPDVCLDSTPPLLLGTAGAAPRIKRSELVLRLLERTHLEPISSVASAISAMPLRVDWRPPVAEDGSDGKPGERRGFGWVFVSLHFRLNANNLPVVAGRAR